MSICQARQVADCGAGQIVHSDRMETKKSTEVPDDLHPEATSKRLVAAREALNLTPSEMADALGVDRSTWSRMEKGERALTTAAAYAASTKFGLSMDFFYRGRLDMLAEDLRSKVLERMRAS